MNVAVVVGTVRTDPELKHVGEDELLVVFDVDSTEDKRKVTVPISWRGTPNELPQAWRSLAAGDEVAVSGTIGRRFIGASVFLVDVRATSITTGGPVKRRNAAKRAVDQAFTD